MYKVLRKLAEKYEKTIMDVEDLALVLKTNLVTTRKRYIVRRHRIQDPKGGPYNIVLKFIFKFTKEYLSIKEANTFLIPEIIFNPLLILSPYLTKLYIKPRHLDNIPVLPDQPLYTITGFRQVARLYSLRYGVGKAFNKNSNYADAQTFLKHYLLRRINLIKAVYRMSQLINLRRPQHLITEQSLLVNENPRIYFLIKVQNKLKLSLKYKTAGKNIKKNWDNKQAVINIKRQLSRVIFSKDIKATLESNNNKLAEHKCLIKVIITLPSTSLEDKIYRRNNAINTVVDYCNIEEGRADNLRQIKEDAKILEVAKALENTKLSLYKEKRPKIYFICLRNQKLLISKRIYRFHTLTALIKHF
ncbi:hypothetical protein V2W45_1464203 [Cenococcum geophilum]